MVGRIMETRTCMDMEVHLCTGGEQLRRWVAAAALGRPDLSSMYGGCRAHDRCNTCVGVWVQGLERGRAAVHGAAAQGCLAVMAQDCVGVVGVSAAGVLQGVQRLQIVWGGLCAGVRA